MRLGNLSKITDKIIDGVLDTLLSEGSELIDNIIISIGLHPYCCYPIYSRYLYFQCWTFGKWTIEDFYGNLNVLF